MRGDNHLALLFLFITLMLKNRIKVLHPAFYPTLLLFLIMVSAVVYSRIIYAPSDDAYIFLVYANNFIQGNGLTFNGMLVEGYSSPLWVTLLSVFGLTGIDLPLLMQILSSISGIFALGATYSLGIVLLQDKTDNYRYWSLLPALLLAATGDFSFYLGSGLEQVLFTGLLALSAATIVKNRKQAFHSNTLPLLLALTILTRPEGVLIAAVIYLYGAWLSKH